MQLGRFPMVVGYISYGDVELLQVQVLAGELPRQPSGALVLPQEPARVVAHVRVGGVQTPAPGPGRLLAAAIAAAVELILQLRLAVRESH